MVQFFIEDKRRSPSPVTPTICAFLISAISRNLGFNFSFSNNFLYDGRRSESEMAPTHELTKNPCFSYIVYEIPILLSPYDYQKHAPALKSWFKHHFKKTAVQLNIVLTVESVQGVISGLNWIWVLFFHKKSYKVDIVFCLQSRLKRDHSTRFNRSLDAI